MKMNKITLAICCLSLCITAKSNGQNLNRTSGEAPDMLKLVYNYAKNSDDSTAFGKLFFLIFPEDFITFNKIYGYDDDDGKMPLYDHYVSHLTLLFDQYKKIPDSIFISKVVKIAVESKWDADAINFFQDKSFNLIHKDPKMFSSILEKYNYDSIRNFFAFIIYSPDRESSSITDKVEAIYSDFSFNQDLQMILMKEYNKILEH